MRAALHPHPTTPDPRVRALDAEVRRNTRGDLAIGFRLDARLDQIALGEAAPPRFVLGLWERTCFEAFVALDGDAGYLELNVSPAREWAILELRGRRVRSGVRSAAADAPVIDVRVESGVLALDVSLALARLRPGSGASGLRIGLSAVIAATSGERSFWALRHPPGAPDFHAPEAFALRLEPAARR